MNPRLFTFVVGDTGPWTVIHCKTVTGDPILEPKKLEIINARRSLQLQVADVIQRHNLPATIGVSNDDQTRENIHSRILRYRYAGILAHYGVE